MRTMSGALAARLGEMVVSSDRLDGIRGLTRAVDSGPQRQRYQGYCQRVAHRGAQLDEASVQDRPGSLRGGVGYFATTDRLSSHTVFGVGLSGSPPSRTANLARSLGGASFMVNSKRSRFICRSSSNR